MCEHRCHFHCLRWLRSGGCCCCEVQNAWPPRPPPLSLYQNERMFRRRKQDVGSKGKKEERKGKGDVHEESERDNEETVCNLTISTHRRMMEEMKAIVGCEMFHDFKFVVEGQEIPVHHIILLSRMGSILDGVDITNKW